MSRGCTYLGCEAEDGAVDGGDDAEDDEHHAHDQALLSRHGAAAPLVTFTINSSGVRYKK